MAGTFDLRATSGAVSTVLGRYTTQATVPPTGNYASTYRYNRAAAPTLGGATGMSAFELPDRFNTATDAVVGKVQYDAVTGKYGLMFDLPTVNPTVVGGILGALGTDATTIANNTTALQAALDSAFITGGTIRLTPGARFGAVYLQNSSVRTAARTWVHVTTDGFDAVRPPGQRHQLADDASMATILTRHVDRDGTVYRSGFSIDGGASFVKLTGIRFALASDVQSGNLLNLGLVGTNVSFNGGATSDNSRWCWIDRCHFDGRSTPDCLQRAVRLHGRFMIATECRFTEIGMNIAADCQCMTWLEFGPYLARGCWFSHEGNSQAIILGGSPLATSDRVPQNVQVLDCYFEGSLQRGLDAKTDFETKYTDKVMVQGCHFVGNKIRSFNHAVTIKLAVNGGPNDTMRQRNFIVRLCSTDGRVPLIGITGKDAGVSPVIDSTKLGIVEQCLEVPATDRAALRTRNGVNHISGMRVDIPEQFVVHHCTMVGPLTTQTGIGFRQGGGDPFDTRTDFISEANIFAVPPEQPIGNDAYFSAFLTTGTSFARNAWNAITKVRSAWLRNGILWRDGDLPTRANGVIGFGTADADVVATDLAAAINTDGTLPVGSPWRGADTDGGDLGADVALVNAATAKARGV